MKPFKAFADYISASRIELTKVTWPSRKQTIRLTFLVIIFSIVFAVLLGAFDWLFSYLLQKVIIKG